jgi:hypothetical protein
MRRDVLSALDAGAHLIPVLCNGDPPDASLLPAPFNRIGELTWLRLRAEHRAADLQRLVHELSALGVEATPAASSDAALRRRRQLLWVGLGAGAAALAGWVVVRRPRRAAPARILGWSRAPLNSQHGHAPRAAG